MKKIVLGLALLLVIVLLILYMKYYGTSSGQLQGTYIHDVNPTSHQQFVKWLEGQGFPEVDSQTIGPVFGGIHKGKEVWYEGTYQGSNKFYVIIRMHAHGNSQNLSALVWYHLSGWKWKREKDLKKINEFDTIIGQWDKVTPN